MRSLTRLLAVSAAVSVAASACVAPTTEQVDTEQLEQAQEALTSCGTAKYNEALVHYKNAVQWSKDRNTLGVCNSVNGFQWAIADEASRAVMTCGDFRNVIRTSLWAAPLRTALAPSLTLRSLSGELLVIKDSAWANWTGTDVFFQSGLSFWARAQGAYGSRIRIDFRSNGKAIWGERLFNEVTGDITWGSSPATYSISKALGNESAVRTITVKHAGKTDSFTLGVENPLEYKAAPTFILQPKGAGTTAPILYSLVTECDA